MIPLSIPQIEGNEWKYIKECLDTNWVSSVGSYVDKFEEKIKEYVGSSTAVVTMNGTAAITLALQTLGIGKGDEVIVPSMTFVASVNPILYVGATPVFIDITEDTWVMDADQIESLITEKTKAIIPVHLYGNMVDMEPLMQIANKYNLYVIEDATEALGSEYQTSDGKWHKAGTLGHFGAFSFNGNKLITTGAGGMLVTNSEQLGERAKYLSTQSKTVLNNGGMIHEEIGYNYRMPNILAAMGVAQLEKINEYIEKKRQHALLYNKLLAGVKGIQLSAAKENIKNCYWLYSILIKDHYVLERDELIQHLKDKGIETRPFFYPINCMKLYSKYNRINLCTTDLISQQGVNLPSSVGLEEQDIQYICDCIKEVIFLSEG